MNNLKSEESLPTLVPSSPDPYRRVVYGKNTCWNSVPTVGDPRWPKYARPLHEWMTGSPRTIDEIVAWGKSLDDRGFEIRNRLAWLSLSGLAEYDPARRAWVAVPTTWPKEILPPPPLPASKKISQGAPTADLKFYRRTR